jgi:hypothetical protein
MRFIVTLAVLSLWSDGARTQSIDFSGQWRVNHAAGDPPGKGAEQIWDVTQTASALTVRLIVNGQERSTYTWPLGGPPIATQRDAFATITSATLGNGELVISGEGTSGTGMKMRLTEQWIIDPDARVLRVSKVFTDDIATTFRRSLVLERVVKP